MKILKHGKKKKKLKGTCDDCGCVVECSDSEAKTMIDRDTVPDAATRYVKCPECGDGHLWVK